MTAALALAATASCAAAANYDTMLKERKYEQAERAASMKLATEPDNAEALIAKINVILAHAADTRLEEAVTSAEQCIAAHPKKSDCHEALGNVLGTKAMMGGIMSAISYAGKIRDAFITAVELDPHNMSARYSLLQYYLQAPGIVGGGKDKARTLIAATAKLDAETARLLQADLDLASEQFASAEAGVLAVNGIASPEVADIQRDVLANVATVYAREKKYADSERVFRELAKRYPDASVGSYGIGRTLQERGRFAEALPYFDKALALEARAHVHYRMAQCWQALNEKAKAVSAFEKALATKPALIKKMRADAEEQIRRLKG